MKLRYIALLAFSAATLAQAPAPTLTLDEKIALSTDDIKRQDILQKLQEEFNEKVKPINDHQQAAIKAIEAEHPGYVVQGGPQGWQLTKKEEKKPEPKK